MRDRTVGETFYMMFTTRAITGIPTVLAGTPVVSAYEDNSVTQITAGITLGVDHDSVVGLNLLTIVATGANGYEAGKDYSMVITTGTVNSVSAVGEVVGEFSLSLSSATTLLEGTNSLANIEDKIDIIDTNVDQIETAVITNAAGTDISADIADVPTVAEFNARTLVAASYFDPAADAVANVTLVATTTVCTDAEADIAALNNISTADVNTQVDTALADINLDHFVGTASGIPALPAGTYLDLLQDDGTATYSRTTDSMQAIRDHIGNGSNLTESGGTGDQLTAINLPNQTMDITGNLSGSVGSVTGAVGSVTGSVGSNLELGPSEVLTQVNAALDTVIAELGVAAPAVTPTLRTGLMLLYMALRNKLDVQTSGTDALELHNDAGTEITSKLITDSGGDYSEAKMT